MVDIVFTDSTCGSLKMAQSYGKGKYHAGCIGVFIHHPDGSEPTQEEIEEETRKAEAEERCRWEQAVPLGGRACDVFGFSMGLSVGDIRDPLNLDSRLDAMHILRVRWDKDTEMWVREQYAEMQKDLEQVRTRIAGGEDASVWYSDAPDERCGFYWLMDELRSLPVGHGTIYALRLPEWEERGDVARAYNSWGDIAPGEFHSFLHLAQPVSDGLRRCLGNVWKRLQEENAPVRAVLNGKLASASEDIYDRFIRAELRDQPDEFWEPMVIGNVLGKYQPGIGDGYVHQRIEMMVQNGELEPITDTANDGYRRKLKKVL